MYPYSLYDHEELIVNDEHEINEEILEQQVRKPTPSFTPPFSDSFYNKPPKQKPGYGDSNGKPTAPPPSYVPRKSSNLLAVDPGSIRGCLYNYTYVWLVNRRSFWLYPTYIGRKSIAGYRWTNFGWAYVGLDTDMIESFYCLPY